jgi:gamma-glutamyltranspeptidase/glutathione hydrolase
MRIFGRGGNAIDAGVAAGLALNVLECDFTGFGGVAPIMVFRPGMREPETLDGLGHWPKARDLGAHRVIYGDDLPPGISRAVTPGAPDAWLTALARHGRLRLADVVTPAMELAEGFPIGPGLAAAIEGAAPRLQGWPSNATIFMPKGRPLRIGEILVQRDLASTFRRLVEAEQSAATSGREAGIRAARDEFYRGRIGQQIAVFMAEVGAGVSAQDLAEHAVSIAPPAHARYRGTDVYACGPWSQGPLVPMTLNLLEGFNVASMGPGSVEFLHHYTEAFKLSCADREGFFGDPDQVDVPIKALLDKRYADERRALLRADRAWPGLPPPGDPWPLEGRPGRAGFVPAQNLVGHAPPDTSYVCTMDDEGNAFSATPSDSALEAPIVPGLGINISARGAQFWLDPAHPSAIAPGKRPRLTPNPAMLLREGRAYMPFGCPGADGQCQAMIQVVCNVLDFGMDVQQAIEYPRVISASFPDSFYPHVYQPGLLSVEPRFIDETRSALERLGHRVEVAPESSRLAASVCAIRRLESGALEGGADPRRDGTAAAW